MASSRYLVLDQGGSGSRALVFDQRGRCLKHSLQPVAVHRDGHRVEHDPEEMVESLRRAASDVVAEADAISAAGLATQRSSIVCWDRETGKALSPVISWQDRRAADWLLQFDPHADWIHRITGLVMSPHYGASKLRWCLDNLPAVADAARDGRLAAGPLAGFLIHRLAEERPVAVDPANASRTLLFNCRTGDWEPDLLQLFGIPPAVLPALVPNNHHHGTLPVGESRIPLTVLTGDQSAALFFVGDPDGRDCYVNIGTGAFIQRATPDFPAADDLLTGLVHDDGHNALYALEGTVNGAANALNAFLAEAGLVPEGLGAALAQIAAPPLYLNGVSGLGAPFWIPEFASRFVGEGEPWARAVAVVESIVFLIQINRAEIAQTLGPARRIVVSGGLAGLDGLCGRLADLSGIAVFRPAEREATARGLAFHLAGHPADWPDPRGDLFQPQTNAALAERFSRWCEAMGEALSQEGTEGTEEKAGGHGVIKKQ